MVSGEDFPLNQSIDRKKRWENPYDNMLVKNIRKNEHKTENYGSNIEIMMVYDGVIL